MQKSIEINFRLPQALVQGIDDYLANNQVDIGRSALLKFCLTYRPPLTPLQKQQSVRLSDDLYRGSNGVIQVITLRCHWRIPHGADTVIRICNVLTYLNLASVFNT